STTANLLFRILPMLLHHSCTELEQLMEGEECHQSNHENDPSLGGVKKSLGKFTLEFGQNSSQSHAAGVGNDGDRNRGYEQYDSNAKLLLEKKAVNQRQECERKQRPDSTAGLHNRERGI